MTRCLKCRILFKIEEAYYAAKTKALQLICVLVSATNKNIFSHDAAQLHNLIFFDNNDTIV